MFWFLPEITLNLGTVCRLHDRYFKQVSCVIINAVIRELYLRKKLSAAVVGRIKNFGHSLQGHINR